MSLLSNKKHYSRNLISKYIATITTTLLGIFSAPISLRYWEVERFGVWAIITSLAVYLSISGLGIDAAAGILMTKNNASETKRIIFRKSLTIVILSSLVFLLIFTIVIFYYPNWNSFLGNMSPSITQNVKIASAIFIISFLINLPFGVISNTFSAYQRAYFNDYFSVLNSIFLFIVLLVVVNIKGSLVTYSTLYCSVLFGINVAKVILYKRTAGKYKSETIHHEDNEDCSYGTIFRTGFNLWFYGLAVLASSNISNLIISNIMDVSKVTPYSLNYKLYWMAFMFLTGINLSSAPLIGREYGNKNWNWIISTYEKFFLLTVIMGGAICLGGMLFLRDILNIWVGSEGMAGIGLIIVLGFYFFFNSLSNVNYVILNSMNFTNGIGLISWSEAGIFIGISIILTRQFGIIGVAIGLLLGTLFVTQWALPLIIYKRSGRRLRYNFKFLSKVFIFMLISIPFSILIHDYLEAWYMRLLFGNIIFFIYIFFVWKNLPSINNFDKHHYIMKLLKKRK